MKKICLTSILIINLIVLTGCGGGLKYNTEIRKITIKTEPYNAKVYQINPVDKHEIFLGMAPIEDQPVSVIKNFWGADTRELKDYMTTQVGMVNVLVEKEGYLPYKGNLSTKKNDILLHRVELEISK